MLYFCDKPFDKGYKCGFKEPQSFTIEVVDEEIGSREYDHEEDVLADENVVACISV